MGRLLLLQRLDTDTSLKDIEGYTAFDLYNSTLNGTKPCDGFEVDAELYTWGVNRYVDFQHFYQTSHSVQECCSRTR